MLHFRYTTRTLQRYRPHSIFPRQGHHYGNRISERATQRFVGTMSNTNGRQPQAALTPEQVAVLQEQRKLKKEQNRLKAQAEEESKRRILPREWLDFRDAASSTGSTDSSNSSVKVMSWNVRPRFALVLLDHIMKITFHFTASCSHRH